MAATTLDAGVRNQTEDGNCNVDDAMAEEYDALEDINTATAMDEVAAQVDDVVHAKAMATPGGEMGFEGEENEDGVLLYEVNGSLANSCIDSGVTEGVWRLRLGQGEEGRGD